MNHLVLKVDYDKYLAFGNGKDEQAMIDILSRAVMYRHNWQKKILFPSGDIPEITLFEKKQFLAEEPVEEVTDNGA